MKFTVIGYWGGYPKANEASAGYLLEHEEYKLLIDCGSAVLSKLQPILQPENIDGVILSHYHPDHTADIGVLQHARLVQGYLGKQMDCLPIYGHLFDENEFSKLTYKNITKGIAYDPSQTLTIGPFRVQFLLTDHPVPCYAMRLEAGGKSIVYTADTSYKEEFVSFCKEADLLVCECNFYGNQNGKNAGHMTSLDAGTLAEKANVRQLLLTHLPHYGDPNQLMEEAATIYNGSISLASYQWSLTF
ncbi:MBL fold metallo-hydrolase [Bacillus sp. S/N-304-OC-R1]|uniref:MBL fold metallo-hydrolase n=1 Tax=Bacillus sp. S/N-304-OC-R1 TaxID=2758034 RepID=UPI001C8E5238|nr:MBL fold metallo-hydrolase [Bacillus sp. S/N-304-OC-R1]MBY0121109.1 MBL fold metallo-hydrolase [Bacillus sp. S/N-304-OC-R1]